MDSAVPGNRGVLFLGGAGLPSWMWDQTRANLPQPSAVAEYPQNAHATLADYAEHVLGQVAFDHIVVVAHSAGGVVASQLAALAPTRIVAVLGVAAAFPAPGQSLLRTLPFPQRAIVGLIMRVAGTKPPEKAIRAGLGTGLNEQDVTRLVSDFSAESPRLFRDAIHARQWPAHRGYVTTSRDAEYSEALQAKYGHQLDPDFKRTLATGHLPMLAEPVQLAQIIQDFVTSLDLPR